MGPEMHRGGYCYRQLSRHTGGRVTGQRYDEDRIQPTSIHRLRRDGRLGGPDARDLFVRPPGHKHFVDSADCFIQTILVLCKCGLLPASQNFGVVLRRVCWLLALAELGHRSPSRDGHVQNVRALSLRSVHILTPLLRSQALLTDAEAVQGKLDASLFPGVPSAVTVHDGFRNDHAKTAPTILAAVQRTLSAHPASKQVTVVGHSLGTPESFSFSSAALALLDGIYLPLHISGVTFRTIGYGMPRIRALGLLAQVSPAADNHVPVSCLSIGQDNTNSACTVGDVGNIFEGDAGDHSGPYDGELSAISASDNQRD
ncbi:lipase class family protein [Salix suchowensis]|nr:lipase class family protein [Salix suchowensis]